MAFNEYRNPREDSESHELDIERFAYDVFAYMLSICGFPKSKIPTSIRKENVYIEDDFIMNVGLSVLPIALYMRDNWKSIFELKLEETEFYNILEIEDFLKSTLLNCPDYEEEDSLSRIQYSLALYNEMILFFNYKGIETYFDSLPKSWSQFCAQLVAESDDIDEPLASFLYMDPDVSETWITDFVGNEAIPYGSSKDVSENFSIYSLENEAVYAFTENVNDNEPVAQGSEPSMPEDSNSELYFEPGKWDFRDSSRQFQVSSGRAFAEMTGDSRNTNGITYVLHQWLKGRKRCRPLKLEVEDAFREISLEEENISPENRDTKRRCKISDKDEHE